MPDAASRVAGGFLFQDPFVNGFFRHYPLGTAIWGTCSDSCNGGGARLAGDNRRNLAKARSAPGRNSRWARRGVFSDNATLSTDSAHNAFAVRLALWSFIRKGGERELDNFPVLVRSMTAAAVPFARSGFRVLIDFSIPPAFLETARKILKEVPFDFVLLRPSLEVCVKRSASRERGAIMDYARLKNFYARFEDARVEPICDDSADPASLARRIAEGLNQGRFRVV
jgi:hypothetical protein